jgi:hypothetical protein
MCLLHLNCPLLQDDEDDEPPGPEGLLKCHVGHISCWDFSLIWIWAAGVSIIILSFHGSLLKRWLAARVFSRLLRLWRRQGQPGSAAGVPGGTAGGDGLSEPLLGASGARLK